jgi:hypothetical protein
VLRRAFGPPSGRGAGAARRARLRSPAERLVGGRRRRRIGDSRRSSTSSDSREATQLGRETALQPYRNHRHGFCADPRPDDARGLVRFNAARLLRAKSVRHGASNLICKESIRCGIRQIHRRLACLCCPGDRRGIRPGAHRHK